MTKYQLYFNNMIARNRDLFEAFEEIHAQYVLEPEIWQEKFNRQGEKIVEIVREYENRLCSYSESGTYGKYSSNLAEKFRSLLKARFPKIDHIGISLSKPFSLKKINFT